MLNFTPNILILSQSILLNTLNLLVYLHVCNFAASKILTLTKFKEDFNFIIMSAKVIKQGDAQTPHFFEYFNDRIPQNWNEPALTDYNGTNNYTYGEMATQMARVQVLFENTGIKRGDKVAICGNNCANWGAAFVGVAAAQGVIVSILSDFNGEDVEKLMNHSDAIAMFAGESVWKKIDVTKIPNLKFVLSLHNFELLYAKTDEIGETYSNWDQLFAQRYPDGYSAKDVKFPTDNLDELMLINYTSGTTSDPKGVMLTYRAMSSNVHFGQERIPNHAGWTEVSMLPLAHMFGLTYEFLYQIAGGCHVYFFGKTPAASLLLKCFAETHPYMILTVPLVIEKIVQAKVFPALQKQPVKLLWKIPGINKLIGKKIRSQLMEAFGGKLIYFIVGGAGLNPEVEKLLRKIDFPLHVGYGMTECAPLISYEDWNEQPFGSCGKCVYRNELKIDSADPHNIVGEILVKGQHVMLGYYKNDEATKAAFTQDGWMRTGDLGVVDAEGNLFIRGRSKNMILSATGQNIYPEELEAAINMLDGVVESVVVERQNKLVALVFPNYKLEGDASLGGKSLEQYLNGQLVQLNQKLPAYERIHSIELVKEEFEKTPKRSIRRFLYK